LADANRINLPTPGGSPGRRGPDQLADTGWISLPTPTRSVYPDGWQTVGSTRRRVNSAV